jgi:AraC family transcriptional regulator
MREETRRSHQERVLEALVFIQDHLEDDLSLDRLARLASCSPYHFHRVFRAVVGESVFEHVRRLRLERAAHLLRIGEAPVHSLAAGAGYDSHEAFTRAFTGRFGMTPSAFRAARRWPAEPPPEPGPPAPADAPRVGHVERVPALRVAFVRHIGPYQEAGAAFERLLAWAGPLGLLDPAPLRIGAARDDPTVTATGHIRFDACITVDERAAAHVGGDVGLQTVGGGLYAATTHHGGYDTLARTYDWLARSFIPATGRAPGQTGALELYLTDPDDRPDELLTDVLLPLSE